MNLLSLEYTQKFAYAKKLPNYFLKNSESNFEKVQETTLTLIKNKWPPRGQTYIDFRRH